MSDLDEPPFIGRRNELARIRTELASGRNVVLTGVIGMGRTTLLHQVAKTMSQGWRFIFLDGSQTAGDICGRIFLDLFPARATPSGRSRTLLMHERHCLSTLPLRDSRPHVIVLDDLWKLTPPKLDFFRWLDNLGRFKIIAVAETSLPGEQVVKLRTAFFPSALITLGRLGPGAAHRFFEEYSRLRGLGWTQGAIHGLALATRGYPLGMWDAAEAAYRLTVNFGQSDPVRL